MTTVTQSDLKELKELIITLKQNKSSQLNQLEKGQGTLKLHIVEIKTKLNPLEPYIQKLSDLINF